MLWDNVVGHDVIKRSLRAIISSGNVNHAYLFAGPRGVGKSLVALSLAASLNCELGGCGECDTCSRILRGVHPDVRMLEPVQKVITMEQVRDMRLDAYHKPSECAHKVFIIKDAERMQVETANAMLKVLEEPPSGVIFILITSSLQAMLPTIRSRCQAFHFYLIPHQRIAAHLVGLGLERERAELLSRTSGGVMGRALVWAEQDWREERRVVVVEVARRIGEAGLGLTLDMVEELHRQVRQSAEEVAGSYTRRLEELDDGSLDPDSLRKIKKQLGRESKQQQAKVEARGLREVLMVLASYYRDILVTSEGGEDYLLINQDRRVEISSDAREIGTRRALACLRVIGEAKRAVARNVDTRANLERTLFGIQEVLGA